MKNKKRRTVDIIESTPRPEIEHHFYKESGKETVENTNYNESTILSSASYRIPIRIKKYTDIHTHPATISYMHQSSKSIKKMELSDSAVPSYPDLHYLLETEKINRMVVAERESDTGKIRGYAVISKTKNTPKISNKNKSILNLDLFNYRISLRDSKEVKKSFDDFMKKYHLKYRFLPAEGYKLNDAGTQFVKSNKNLESKIVTSVFGMFAIAGLFFGFSSLTGAVIGFSKSFSMPVGILLFVLGILGLFFSRKLRE